MLEKFLDNSCHSTVTIHSRDALVLHAVLKASHLYEPSQVTFQDDSLCRIDLDQEQRPVERTSSNLVGWQAIWLLENSTDKSYGNRLLYLSLRFTCLRVIVGALESQKTRLASFHQWAWNNGTVLGRRDGVELWTIKI